MNSKVDCFYMARALRLASQGRGSVEPNPMVGCAIVNAEGLDLAAATDEALTSRIVGEGWHQKYGDAHAEVNALRVAGERAKGATLYVTLEPCSHFGKTPPCADAVIASGVKRVVMAMRDPFPKVDGTGLEKLQNAGIEVTVGVMESEARELNAPYLMRLTKKRPWIVAKWAATLDGKLASRALSSNWISCEESRRLVHQWRGESDAIVVGSRTAVVDNPMLTVRLPEGQTPKRIPTRIVICSAATLSLDSNLAATASAAPLLLVWGPNASESKRALWEEKGAEILVIDEREHEKRFAVLMEALAERGMTNVMVEGGGELLGHLFDMELIDEVRAFICPKLIGGRDAVFPFGGVGRELMSSAATLRNKKIEIVGDDVLITGRVNY